ncbi:hypothetical protein [Aquamicrobium ahrensii]|uniref:Transposase n=1 Tax=Aquamicrobium ahrensii TaxID=469551 RepID=A0ABV2KIR7_9HYPH
MTVTPDFPASAQSISPSYDAAPTRSAGCLLTSNIEQRFRWASKRQKHEDRVCEVLAQKFITGPARNSP